MSTSDLFQDVETFSLSTYPKTRFQGSKRKLLRHLALAFDTCPNNLAHQLTCIKKTRDLIMVQPSSPERCIRIKHASISILFSGCKE